MQGKRQSVIVELPVLIFACSNTLLLTSIHVIGSRELIRNKLLILLASSRSGVLMNSKEKGSRQNIFSPAMVSGLLTASPAMRQNIFSPLTTRFAHQLRKNNRITKGDPYSCRLSAFLKQSLIKLDINHGSVRICFSSDADKFRKSPMLINLFVELFFRFHACDCFCIPLLLQVFQHKGHQF